MFYAINRLSSLAVFEFSDLNVNTDLKQAKPLWLVFYSVLSRLFVYFDARAKVTIVQAPAALSIWH